MSSAIREAFLSLLAVEHAKHVERDGGENASADTGAAEQPHLPNWLALCHLRGTPRSASSRRR